MNYDYLIATNDIPSAYVLTVLIDEKKLIDQWLPWSEIENIKGSWIYVCDILKHLEDIKVILTKEESDGIYFKINVDKLNALTILNKD